jgi:predicted nucleotidyltransferase
MYKILTRETSMVSITLFGSILRIKEKTASLISASISCSLEAPALMTAARTCKILEVTMQGLINTSIKFPVDGI